MLWHRVLHAATVELVSLTAVAAGFSVEFRDTAEKHQLLLMSVNNQTKAEQKPTVKIWGYREAGKVRWKLLSLVWVTDVVVLLLVHFISCIYTTAYVIWGKQEAVLNQYTCFK